MPARRATALRGKAGAVMGRGSSRDGWSRWGHYTEGDGGRGRFLVCWPARRAGGMGRRIGTRAGRRPCASRSCVLAARTAAGRGGRGGGGGGGRRQRVPRRMLRSANRGGRRYRLRPIANGGEGSRDERGSTTFAARRAARATLQVKGQRPSTARQEHERAALR